MSFSLLHLNVERSKHADSVKNLLLTKKPDVVCFAEAMHKDVEILASSLNYNLAYAPRMVLGGGIEGDQEGSAILSKYPILRVQKHRYDDGVLGGPPVYKNGDPGVGTTERPKDRFEDNYTFLTALIQLNDRQTVTVATTHFPVTDHTTPGLEDHDIKNLQNDVAIEKFEVVEGVSDHKAFLTILNVVK